MYEFIEDYGGIHAVKFIGEEVEITFQKNNTKHRFLIIGSGLLPLTKMGNPTYTAEIKHYLKNNFGKEWEEANHWQNIKENHHRYLLTKRVLKK